MGWTDEGGSIKGGQYVIEDRRPSTTRAHLCIEATGVGIAEGAGICDGLGA